MLHALSFSTFDEIAALNFELHVHCPSCHATRRLSLDGQHWRDRCFATTRFRCRAVSIPNDFKWSFAKDSLAVTAL